jgi:YHS domain-containing protein
MSSKRSAAAHHLVLAIFIAGVFTVLTNGAALAADPKIYSSWGKAIKGYDPVAYFTSSKPVEGDSKFTHEWNGATWRFASAENRDKFKSEPEKYAPQFGGYCAWAVSQGYVAPTDPDAWKIVDGKLYLNYSASVQKQWASNQTKFISDGHANWPGIDKRLKN